MRTATVIHFNSIVASPYSTCLQKKSGEMTAHAEFRELK